MIQIIVLRIRIIIVLYSRSTVIEMSVLGTLVLELIYQNFLALFKLNVSLIYCMKLSRFTVLMKKSLRMDIFPYSETLYQSTIPIS